MTTLVLVTALEVERGRAAAVRTAIMVGVLFVLPVAALTAVQVRRGVWSTVDASHPRERPLLFAVGGAGVLAVVGYFWRTRPGTPFVTGGVGVLAMLAVCATLTPWLKVSLHMAAAALAAAVLLERGMPLGWLLAVLLPLLAWARVALGRHRWSEVVLGVAIGGITGMAVVRFS